MKKSNLYKINVKDALRSFLLVVISSVLTAIVSMLDAGEISLTMDNIKAIITTGVLAGISYLLKNFFTDSRDKITIPKLIKKKLPPPFK